MAFPDYEEFIAALNAHGVRYLIVGAHAVAYHGHPRATKDLDILLDPAPANARRAIAALRAFFGGKDPGFKVADLTDPRWVVQLGVAPVRIDLLSNLPGSSSFQILWRKRVEASFGSVKASYLALDDLIRTKEATGRPQDHADAQILRRAKRQAELRKRTRRRSC
jgi:predicted nucleotidyltransferase